MADTRKFVRCVENNRVEFIHNVPFSPTDGMQKTEAELLQEGFLVDSIPVSDNVPGKTGVMYMDPDANQIYFIYEDVPMNQDNAGTMTLINNAKSLVASGQISAEVYKQMTGVDYQA